MIISWLRSSFCIVVILLILGSFGIVSLGCGEPCGSLQPTYKLTSNCLVEGESKGTCKVQQNECVVVLECGDALPRCRGYMTGRGINLSCTLPDLREHQAIADPRDNGYQLLIPTKNECRVQLTAN